MRVVGQCCSSGTSGITATCRNVRMLQLSHRRDDRPTIPLARNAEERYAYDDCGDRRSGLDQRILCGADLRSTLLAPDIAEEVSWGQRPPMILLMSLMRRFPAPWLAQQRIF